MADPITEAIKDPEMQALLVQLLMGGGANVRAGLKQKGLAAAVEGLEGVINRGIQGKTRGRFPRVQLRAGAEGEFFAGLRKDFQF